jgi:hypothetical protein
MPVTWSNSPAGALSVPLTGSLRLHADWLKARAAKPCTVRCTSGQVLQLVGWYTYWKAPTAASSEHCHDELVNISTCTMYTFHAAWKPGRVQNATVLQRTRPTLLRSKMVCAPADRFLSSPVQHCIGQNSAATSGLARWRARLQASK